MKKYNQNTKQPNKIGKANTRSPFLSKSKRRLYIKAGAAIFAIIILHFVSQFIFIQNEKLEIEVTSAATENEQSVESIENIKSIEIKPPEDEAKTSEIVRAPVPVMPVAKPETTVAPSRSVIKKKEPRESRAERLRRAERILTGV
jgi:type IV secretory pathway VirB10-like protein